MSHLLGEIRSELTEYRLSRATYELAALIPFTISPQPPYPQGSEPVVCLYTSASAKSFDWSAFDEAITAHSYGTEVKFDRKRPNMHIDKAAYREWKPLTKNDEKFITQHLPLLSAANRILVVIPPPTEDIKPITIRTLAASSMVKDTSSPTAGAMKTIKIPIARV